MILNTYSIVQHVIHGKIKHVNVNVKSAKNIIVGISGIIAGMYL